MLCGISYRFNSYPPLLVGYRVTHPFATHPEEQALPSAFYLHVLGTPPAFVLSRIKLSLKVWVLTHFCHPEADLLFFFVQYTTYVVAPTIVSSCSVFKVFISQATTISVYLLSAPLSTLFEIFYLFFIFSSYQETTYNSNKLKGSQPLLLPPLSTISPCC